MVGPSLTPDEYAAGMNRLRAAFVALVGVSGALIALANGADLVLAAAAFLAALALGAVLVWYLAAILPGPD